MNPALTIQVAELDFRVFRDASHHPVHDCGGNIVDIDHKTGIGFCDSCGKACQTEPVPTSVDAEVLA